ncbi:hypothetical protein OX459_01915 [Janthinobacterium sp. SUN026]|uniref:hypothetical protein n=1 Tax=Janthinobacterium sp. SUN026 TaxID=3002438 RepID=UPI0025AF741C|nr:hypothetical protein [Janthinobacterium sp. SUN026]MDN2670145.1 hypothetical protein [Janthinobacterium sp. SUN026]
MRALLAGRKADADYAAGDLMGRHFPLAYIDNHPPARLSEWIAAPSWSCKRPAQEAGMPLIHVYLFSTRTFGIFFIES